MEAQNNVTEQEPELVEVLIEIPKGSRNKYEYDPASGFIRFDRMLFSSVHYPSDYGFIRDTLAGDGDPLDTIVLVWEPTFPGCLIKARPVGVFCMSDENGIDDKVLCVPIGDPQWNHIHQLEQVPEHLLKEIRHFFLIYKDLQGVGPISVCDWEGRDRALEIIHSCQQVYQSQQAELAKAK
ncbi:MAG: inorganic diphosphatase [Anaerolineae bacterium]